MSFLNFENKNILVLGVANKKSVAWHIAQTLEEEGANVIFSVRSGDRKNSLDKLLTGKSVYICDVEKPEDIVVLSDGSIVVLNKKQFLMKIILCFEVLMMVYIW